MFDPKVIRKLDTYVVFGDMLGAYGRICKTITGDPLDLTTMQTVENALRSVLQNMKTNRVFSDFSIVCDYSNNPPNWLDNNPLPKVDIYIRWTLGSDDFTTINFPDGLHE